MARFKWDKESIKKLKCLYIGKELTVPQTARSLGVTPDTVRCRLKQLGWLVPYELRNTQGRYQKKFPLERVMELYGQQGKTTVETAAEIGWSTSSVWKNLAKRGLLIHRTALTEKELTFLVNRELSAATICSHMRIKMGTLRHLLRKYNLKIKEPQP